MPMISYTGWIVFDAWGLVSLKKKEPALGQGQRAVYLTLRVPDSLFKRPSLRAEISIPDGGSADTLTASVVGSIQEHVKASTGIDVVLSSVTPPAETEDPA